MKALPILFDVPTLEIDAVLYKDRAMQPQGRVDRRVVWNTLHALAMAGYVPVRVFDGDTEIEVDGSVIETMELVFDLDTAQVFFKHPTEKGAPWAFFVLGNSGPYALSNYTTKPDTFAAVLNQLDFDRMV